MVCQSERSSRYLLGRDEPNAWESDYGHLAASEESMEEIYDPVASERQLQQSANAMDDTKSRSPLSQHRR